MNRFVLRVLNAYLLALLIVSSYLPWYGRPIAPWADLPVLIYAPLWHPPRTLGYVFHPAAVPIALVVLCLTAILGAALVSLWGEEEK